jgi:ABC-type multidrug transport system fused ATPase/permease subunit
VAVILLRSSTLLGTFVLIGVPVFTGVLLLLAKPIKKRQDAQRTAAGKMTTLGADVVAGLRIMRGIGGERQFLARFTQASTDTRDAGLALATPLGVLQGLQVLVGGILLVGLTGIGAVLTVEGKLQPGELVSFYGYAGFLVTPVRLAVEAIINFGRAHVAASRVLSTLGVAPLTRDHTSAADAKVATHATLHDSKSGLTVRPGTNVAVVAADPNDSRELLDRLARLDDDALQAHPVTWDGRPTTDIALDDLRARVTLIDPEPHFFTGELRRELDPWARHADADIVAAVHAAAADDVWLRCRTGSTPKPPTAGAPSPEASGSAWAWPGVAQ